MSGLAGLGKETVNCSARKQQFLEHLQKTKISESKTTVLGRNYETIKRDMQRGGAWHSNARFLDVGCGIGIYSEYWHSRGLRVTGVDIDADQITRARQRAAVNNLSILYETGTAERLPLANQSFDIVFANSVLEHVENWERCLDEWIRVLAPGGLLWIETTNVLCPRQGEYRWLPVYSWWPGPMKHIALHLARGPFPALANYSPCPALHWFSFFQLRKFLEVRGLSVRDRFDCMDLTRVGVAKRMVRNLALSGVAGRWVAYLLVSPLVILASSPPHGGARTSTHDEPQAFDRHQVLAASQ